MIFLIEEVRFEVAFKAFNALFMNLERGIWLIFCYSSQCEVRPTPFFDHMAWALIFTAG